MRCLAILSVPPELTWSQHAQLSISMRQIAPPARGALHLRMHRPSLQCLRRSYASCTSVCTPTFSMTCPMHEKPMSIPSNSYRYRAWHRRVVCADSAYRKSHLSYQSGCCCCTESHKALCMQPAMAGHSLGKLLHLDPPLCRSTWSLPERVVSLAGLQACLTISAFFCTNRMALIQGH